MSETSWVKATRSNNQEGCVEQRRSGETIEVRDTKDRSGPVLVFTPHEFACWIDGAKRGEFDHLI